MYRGFDIYPLIYAHAQNSDGRRAVERGYDAAVKICRHGLEDASFPPQTFKLDAGAPYATAGEARRASLRYAEAMIDKQYDKP